MQPVTQIRSMATPTRLVMVLIATVVLLGVGATLSTVRAATGTPPVDAPATQLFAAPSLDGTLSAELAARESTYQQQLDQLQAAYQERNATYTAQIQELTQRLESAKSQYAALEAQTGALHQQLTQLEQARNERATLYAGQVAAARQQYEAQNAQIQAQLDQARTQLAEAYTALGR